MRFFAQIWAIPVFVFVAFIFQSAPVDAGEPSFLLGVSSDGESCLIGGALQGKLAGPKALAPLMRHGDLYQLLNLNKKIGIAPAIGTPRDESGDGGDCSGLWLQALALDPLRKKQTAIALRLKPNNKNLGKVPIKRLDRDSPEYRGLLHTFLVRKGIKKPVIRITQVISADFDGDGREDLLINAVRTSRNKARRGDYSIILLKLKNPDTPRPLVIQDEITTKASRIPGNLWVNVVVAIVDIDGDGKPEIVLEGQSRFGGGWEVIRLKNGKIEHSLFCGCEG